MCSGHRIASTDPNSAGDGHRTIYGPSVVSLRARMMSCREIMPSKCRAAFSTGKLRALTLTISSRNSCQWRCRIDMHDRFVHETSATGRLINSS